MLYTKNYSLNVNKIIISPHFDDACISAFAQLGKKSLMITVFSGFPKIEQRTKWDIFCGFKNSTEAISKRREENVKVAKYIGFQTIDLGFVDWQYNQKNNKETIKRKIIEVIKLYPSAIIFCPMSFGGLVEHSDHVLITEIILEISSHLKSPPFFYADLPYQGNQKLKWENIENKEKKITACKIYKSQLPRLFEAFPGFNYLSLAKEAYLPLENVINLKRKIVVPVHLDPSDSE
ncbi:MAG: hypothetical protein A2860_04205 [Candidatus Levybacteria bacterium RIFCSPHIGHO2_01_FULL_37_33]|nr:MAG: hypothetical protein A2860_04205 [Candidatus Levybacteria bacterium RIFCSPHIGHO2_01_FULL_37_33]